MRSITFTIEEFKAYLTIQDSLGDAMYNLNEDNILKASDPSHKTEEELEAYYNNKK